MRPGLPCPWCAINDLSLFAGERKRSHDRDRRNISMTDNRVWKLPESAPDPAALAAAWSKVVENGLAAIQAGARPSASLAFDPTAPVRAMFDFQRQLWTNPLSVLQ